MTRRTFNDESDGAPLLSGRNPLTCRVSGCTYRWAVDMSHGKVCSMHDDFFSRNPGEKSPGQALAAPMQPVGEWWKSPAERAQTPTRPLPLQPPKHQPSRPYSEPADRDEVDF